MRPLDDARASESSEFQFGMSPRLPVAWPGTGTGQPAFLIRWRGEVRREGRQYGARAAWRAEAYDDSTMSTATKRNGVLADLMTYVGRQAVRHAG